LAGASARAGSRLVSPEELLQEIGVRQLPPPSVKSKPERAQADRDNGKARSDELHDRTLGDFEARVDSPPMDKALTPPDGYETKWHGDANEAPPKEWRVDRMLPKVGKALAAGQCGTFKTFAVLDLARTVMTKTPFASRSINRQGGVLFIAAGGQDEVRVRLEGITREKVGTIEGLCDVVRIDPARMPFAWIESCPRLTADDAIEKLRNIVASAARGMRDKFGLPTCPRRHRYADAGSRIQRCQ
jgi:hypothetical protein